MNVSVCQWSCSHLRFGGLMIHWKTYFLALKTLTVFPRRREWTCLSVNGAIPTYVLGVWWYTGKLKSWLWRLSLCFLEEENERVCLHVNGAIPTYVLGVWWYTGKLKFWVWRLSLCLLEEENERVCLSMEPFPLTFWVFDDTLENLSPGSEDSHCVS